MIATRYWTSTDGRRTIDLDAVTEVFVSTTGEARVWGTRGPDMAVIEDGEHGDDADSFLAALKAWRSYIERVTSEHVSTNQKANDLAEHELSRRRAGPSAESSARAEFGEEKAEGRVDLRGFRGWPGTPAPVGIEVEFLVQHGRDACSLWGGFAENAPERSIAWRYGCYRMPPNWREIVEHFAKGGGA